MEVLVLLAMLSVGVIIAVAWRMHAIWRREQALPRGGCPRCGQAMQTAEPGRSRDDQTCTSCGWSRADSRRDARTKATMLGALDDKLVYTACILLILAVVTLLTLATYA
jgi:ribosomal protein L37E